jgi:uncharacterized protein
MITWDESKRLINLRKHKIDLASVEGVFDSPMITVEDERASYGEYGCRAWASGKGALSSWSGDDTAHLMS